MPKWEWFITVFTIFHFQPGVDPDAGSRLAAMTAVNITCLIMWAPFYATSVLVVFCEGRLCVDPTVWSLMIWVGYTTAGLTPLLWILDASVRRGFVRIIM